MVEIMRLQTSRHVEHRAGTLSFVVTHYMHVSAVCWTLTVSYCVICIEILLTKSTANVLFNSNSSAVYLPTFCAAVK